MNKEKVGLVAEQEKEEIQNIFEKKQALIELIPSLNSGLLSNEQRDGFHKKVLADIEKTDTLFNQWWNEKTKKYNWKSAENGNWHIDFETNEIILTTK